MHGPLDVQEEVRDLLFVEGRAPRPQVSMAARWPARLLVHVQRHEWLHAQ